MNRRLRFSALACAALLTTGTTAGCYGKFGLTSTVYGLNGGIENKWLRSLAFVGLAVVQVYTISAVADVFVLNVIEFWTGSNPIGGGAPAPGAAKVEQLEDGSLRIVSGEREYRVVPRAEDAADVYLDGELIGSGRLLEDGRVSVVDARGEIVTVAAR